MADEATSTEAAPEATTAPDTGTQDAGTAPENGNGNGSPDEPETFSRDYVEKLRKEAANHRSRLREFEAAEKERLDAEKSELDKANELVEQLRAEKAQSDITSWRAQAAVKHGIDADMLDFLDGSSEEEIEDRAKRLAERLSAQQQQQQRAPAVPRGPQGGAPADPQAQLGRDLLALAGRQAR